MTEGMGSAHPRRAAVGVAAWLALLVLGIAGVRWHTYDEPLERDLTLYAEIGRELLLGRPLYADLWDNKPPGIHFTFAAAQAVAGTGRPGIYLLGLLTAALTTLGVYAAGTVRGGRPAGLLAASLWALACSDLALQANQPNTEAFQNAFTAIGFALLLRATGGGRAELGRFAWIGLAFALASTFKQVILAVAACLAVAHVVFAPQGGRSWRARLAEIGVMIGAIASVWLLIAGYFALVGHHRDFVWATLLYNRFLGGSMVENLLAAVRPDRLVPSQLVFVLPLAAVTAFGLFWETQWGASRRPWQLLAAYAVGVFGAVAAPGMFHAHYYQLWLPLVAIGAAWTTGALYENARFRGVAIALGAALLAGVAWHTLPQLRLSSEEWSRQKYGEIFVETERVGREIDALLPPGETFYHWGNDSGLYFSSGRRPPTGHMFTRPLILGPLADELSQRTLALLEPDPPPLLVARIKWLELTPPDHPVLSWLMERYEPLENAPASTEFAFYTLRSAGAITGASAPGPNQAAVPSRGRPPNIVVILMDDLGWDDPAFTGNSFHETPNIDRLAAEGMQFSDAYSPSPNCLPARASLMTGLFTPRHRLYTAGGRSKGPPENRMLRTEVYATTLPSKFVSLAEAVAPAGYVSAAIGKWHLGDDPERGPLAQGFDVNVGGYSQMPGRYFSPYGNPAMKDGPVGEYITDRLAAEAVRFIDEHRDEPFFLYLATRAVHRPMQAKPEIENKYRRKQASDLDRFGSYDPTLAATLEAADMGIGRILAKLEELGLDEETVVFLTSDHGAANRNTSQTLRGTKGMLYEGGIRVPFIVRWPGVVRASSVSDVPVSLVDVFPTLVAISGSSPPVGQHSDGMSLLPLLEGRPFDRDRPIFWHFPLYLGGGSADPIDPWYPRRMRATPASAVRMGDWKLIEFAEGRHVELYDLRADIGERHDLAEAEPARLQNMLRRLERWRDETGAFFPSEPDPAYDPSASGSRGDASAEPADPEDS